MSVNLNTGSGLQTLANGSRIWIGTKEAYNQAKLVGALPTNCLIAITNDEDDYVTDEITEDDGRAVTSGAVYDATSKVSLIQTFKPNNRGDLRVYKCGKVVNIVGYLSYAPNEITVDSGTVVGTLDANARPFYDTYNIIRASHWSDGSVTYYAHGEVACQASNGTIMIIPHAKNSGSNTEFYINITFLTA